MTLTLSLKCSGTIISNNQQAEKNQKNNNNNNKYGWYDDGCLSLV
ncbi:hypothetical protein DFA_11071 [Cavenderia fasciculata]|uniref:Uncharacterized protein n=1 Tax=Cavenderia fasciculata TaxID=261658 RepID=F4QEP9_CACFS|nr:uncharacterized protein DFA_11071 [Cavenderia fasciculata]EGG13310.1 hypothetical protein DFA_11071 [Cavenderia fasciculata]|eukprot:XP_004350009.1 hypothetical protein DFA_11071 [Cavenderia fasciculata]